MFNKKSCKNCGEKISPKNNFCPSCGAPVNGKPNKGDYGMLGKNDASEDKNQEENFLSDSIFSGFGGKVMGKMLNSTIKMLEKEMAKSMKEAEKLSKAPRNHFELYINGKKINPENIKVTNKPVMLQKKSPKKEVVNQNKLFTRDKKEIFQKLDREEPKSNLKRLSDKVTYEVSLPGVKSINDVSIVRLENSIEIKAVSEKRKKSYEKIIPVKMNLAGYFLEDETLFIELKEI